ncbi:hypothetical protein EJ05DRAFT_113767 [Pseudovirgaria hyperparasitica]|uniref:RING-type domain-containing protein n=1 Tax=Pseudovirgaria hyperparasitica TaxID=470096 RepID=A0A6A6W1C9_9PEZI|nr:uncharacterized protein EJ05DRAFT_113767 [Pseudovirgaria hyperparasitica]KAF2755740.1 hypothetical protein EJ05DRAFT_113767 [Pseudovirgaria hyperparasitica]
MSRIQMDQLIDDDEEEVCPLCVEELDLDDRGFRPCPCGYQICRFCHHNIKTNMNGLCPACRRVYEDKNIVMVKPTPEEAADYHKRQAQRQKRTAVAKQKEAQRREADTLGRKHLAGLRVVQKNLVYVTGLSPTTQESKLLETLRGPDYFGQYGKIIKIVVSKAKDTSHHHQSVGVYVTFARKEDAQACIDCVDGSANGERTLRAQHGTTKYCSAYLRNETCNNKSCMFLHEPGDEGDRFTRQDLSALNISQSNHPHNSMNPQPAPVQQAPIAAATPMQRDESSEGSHSVDGSALPSSASWGSKPVQLPQDRRTSRATTSSEASPAVSHSAPTQSEVHKSEPATLKQVNTTSQRPTQPPSPEAPQSSSSSSPSSQPTKPNRMEHLENFLKILSLPWENNFSMANLSERDQAKLDNMPMLLDPYGGEKLRIRREKEAKLKEEQAQAVGQATVPDTAEAVDAEDDPASGSLQLGGEPEEQPNTAFVRSQHAIGPPPLPSGLGQNLSLGDESSSFGFSGRGMNAQQNQQQLLMQRYKDNPNASNLLNSFQNNQQAQQLSHGLSSGSAPSHARQTSKFSFANESGTASTAVKPVPNQKFMNQQNAMLPPQNSGPFSHQGGNGHLGNHSYYTGSVQGPPPGLKTTGTPPVSGGGMFGQGHGFATGGLGYGANATGRNNTNEEMMQRLLRGQRADGHGADAGKRESMFPSFLQSHSSTSSTPAPAPGLHNYPYGPQPGAYQDAGPQKQKKKSKKHRHANTSSSGGGGLVDVSDPSILQARLQHGGGPMGGQGIYGGQGQGGFNAGFPGGYNNNRW